MNPLLVNPFTDPSTVAGYEGWYETTGKRADRLEKAILGRLLAWRLQRSGESLWQMARFFTWAELVHVVQRAAAGKPVKITWRTTLWPFWLEALPLPWGGLIGMGVRQA